MKKAIKNKNDIKVGIVVYQAKDGAIELRGDFGHENIWATLDQIADVFERDKTTISKHIKTVFKAKELDISATVAKNATVQMEGGRVVRRVIEYYNLDVMLSVGYRVNSKTAAEFRKWATKTLREHIIKGYTINRRQITKNYDAFIKSVSGIQELLPEHTILDPKAVLDLVKEFSSTWLSLNAYDKGFISSAGATKRSVKLTGVELMDVILNLRDELIRKDEATDIFAQERIVGTIEGIVGNVMQSFAGKDVYGTIEEKAANLLYFMIKDHPFIDGNKRSGAFAFVWFLRKAKAKKARNINPSALTSLTLLIAESNPNKKDQMIALVAGMLK